MTGIRTHRILVASLALMAIFACVGCQKLNLKTLTGNYHFNAANQLFKDSDFRKAINSYEKALAANPGLKDAYRFLGESYKALYIPGRDSAENKDKAAKALEALQKAYDLNPDDKDVIYSLGDMFDKLRDVDSAEKMYLRIIDLEPANMNNYYVVAEFYKRFSGEKQEFKAKAEQMYLRRIETDPENVQGYAYMYQYFDNLSPTEHKDKFDRALEYELRRQQLEPGSAEMFYTIGVNRFNKAFQLQNYLAEAEKQTLANEAEKNLNKAIEIDPNLAESYAYMKILYINVSAKVFPEKESRYLAEAERFGQRWDDARKRQLERMKLEKELKKTT